MILIVIFLKTLPGHSSNACAIGFDNKAEHLFAGTEGGTVYVWNLGTQSATQLKGHKTGITSIALEEQSNLIATSSLDSTVRIWDLRAGSSSSIYTF